MIYILFCCAAIALAYAYVWHHGVRWLKNTIERECNVIIDDPIVITRNAADGENA